MNNDETVNKLLGDPVVETELDEGGYESGKLNQAFNKDQAKYKRHQAKYNAHKFAHDNEAQGEKKEYHKKKMEFHQKHRDRLLKKHPILGCKRS